MTPDVLADHFRDELGERVIDATVAYDQLTVTVEPEDFPTVARFCKKNLGMSFFDFLAGVDEREDGFGVVARVYNHITRSAVLLKTTAPGGRDEPRMPTISDVYRGANWHERETYDMFGIVFEGHPELLPRILTVENFEGWPLRKEFKLVSREVKPWPGAKEPGGDDEDAKPKAAAAPTPGADPGDRAAAAKAKAERAKAKAAAARKKKAEEKAAAQAADSAPEDAAAGQPTEPHAPDATTPEGASKIADSAAAKDAAAGQPAGDTGAPAPGEQEGSGEPDIDPDREAEVASGGPAESGGTPGVEAEGVHDLDDSSARPSGDGDGDDTKSSEGGNA